MARGRRLLIRLKRKTMQAALFRLKFPWVLWMHRYMLSRESLRLISGKRSTVQSGTGRLQTTLSPGGYYGGADKEADDSDVRKDFPDTAFWEPTIVTDRKGTARVSFQMPDSLTTWRATVRAHTQATQVGFATRDVIATKDLICRLSTPRSLRWMIRPMCPLSFTTTQTGR